MERRRTAGDWWGKPLARFGATWACCCWWRALLGWASGPTRCPPAGNRRTLDGTQVFVRGLLNALPSLLLCLLTLALTRRTLLSLALAGPAHNRAARRQRAQAGCAGRAADPGRLHPCCRSCCAARRCCGTTPASWAWGRWPWVADCSGCSSSRASNPPAAAPHSTPRPGGHGLLGLASLGAGLAPWPQLYAPGLARLLALGTAPASVGQRAWSEPATTAQLGLRPAASRRRAGQRRNLHGQVRCHRWPSQHPARRPRLPDIIVVQSRSRCSTRADCAASIRARCCRRCIDWPPVVMPATCAVSLRWWHRAHRIRGADRRRPALRAQPRPTLPAVVGSPADAVCRRYCSRSYATLAIHPNDGSFWNRTATFRAMGWRLAAAPSPRRGATATYVADEEINARILAALDEGAGRTSSSP